MREAVNVLSKHFWHPWPRQQAAERLFADLADYWSSTCGADPIPTARPTGPIEIPNAPGRWYQETLAHYDYAAHASRCPICGGPGLPWRGIFHCDGRCHAIALVESGRTFLPVRVTDTPPPR